MLANCLTMFNIAMSLDLVNPRLGPQQSNDRENMGTDTASTVLAGMLSTTLYRVYKTRYSSRRIYRITSSVVPPQ